MELTFQKSDMHCMDTILREVRNQEQTQEIKLSDGMPDIGRVLAGWGMPIIRGKEWHSNRISVNGGVMVWVLYAPEDGTDARCVENWIPFQMEWDISDGERDGQIRILPLLRFVDARSVSARKMMVRVGLAAMAEASVPAIRQISQPDGVEADIQLLQNTYPVQLQEEIGEKAFLLDEDLSLPGSCPVPEKLISCTLHPEITEQSVTGNRVVFKGNGNLHMLYRSEDGQLHTWDFELPFSQLGNLEMSSDAPATSDVILSATSLETDLDENGHLRVKCGLLAQYAVSRQVLTTVTEDAYGIHRQVTPNIQMLQLPVILENRQENIYGEQTIPQDGNIIVDVCFLPDFPHMRRMGDKVELEIPGQFQVLYYGEDGFLQSATARWEGASRITAGDEIMLDLYPQSGGRSSAMFSGGQILLKGNVSLGIQSRVNQQIPMVVGLEAGQPEAPDNTRPSLILRRAGDESLWQLAKDAGSTVAAIRQANGLQSDPISGQMLLVPVS